MTRAFLGRAFRSAVVWTWGYNCVRLFLGLILLPMVLRFLSQADLGMFYLFMALVQMLPLVEAAFSFNVGRQVTFAMGGAVRLLPQGTDPNASTGMPNLPLVRQLVDATGVVYAFLSAGVVVLLGTVGTAIVWGQVDHTSSPGMTWLAWAVTILGTVVEIQSLRWVGFVRNMNRIMLSAQLGAVAYAAKAVLASALLALHCGLMSVPVAGICSGLFLWRAVRRRTLASLGPAGGRTHRAEVWELLRVVWPNTWRAGLKIGSEYAANVSLTSLCTYYFGLIITAQYGLSLQLLQILQQLAVVWTQVKWPIAGQLRAQKRLADMRALLWGRVWLQNLTFMAGAAVLVLIAEPLLRLVRIDKEPLSTGLFALLAINQFLYMRFAFWVNLIATDNRLPSLWPTVATNALAVAGAAVLVKGFGWGIEALVWAPLLTGLLFNYWFWMLAGARELGTTWWRFVRSSAEAGQTRGGPWPGRGNPSGFNRGEV